MKFVIIVLCELSTNETKEEDENQKNPLDFQRKLIHQLAM